MNVIENRDLVKQFSRVKALDGVSFQVDSGAITGLIGPNGAGKTTTIKIMLGLLRPDSGSSLVLGEGPWNNPRVAERVGVIQERARFPQGMNVEDYLSRVARLYGHPATKVLDDLKRVELDSARDRQIGKLSAGMLQKFALVHALMNEPELVIADEPTSNLDPQVRSQVLDLIVSLNQERGTTFLISSHLLPELSRICDTAAIIRNGKIVGSGNLQDLYKSFRADVVRVTTDKSRELAERIRSLDYVASVEVSGESILVETGGEATEEALYRDVPKLASEAGAKLYGIESKSASLEELFRRAVSTEPGKDGGTS